MINIDNYYDYYTYDDRRGIWYIRIAGPGLSDKAYDLPKGGLGYIHRKQQCKCEGNE